MIDGARFEDLRGFAREFSSLLTDHRWRGSLDAFDDILCGGFGTLEDGFVLRWLNSDRSRDRLGWPATVAWYEQTLTTCHPSNRPHLSSKLDEARVQRGTTLFDWLVEIIETHGPGGDEAEDNVHLELA